MKATGVLAYLQHDEAVLAKSRALHWEGGGGAGVGGGEVVVIGHRDRS